MKLGRQAAEEITATFPKVALLLLVSRYAMHSLCCDRSAQLHGRCQVSLMHETNVLFTVSRTSAWASGLMKGTVGSAFQSVPLCGPLFTCERALRATGDSLDGARWHTNCQPSLGQSLAVCCIRSIRGLTPTTASAIKSTTSCARFPGCFSTASIALTRLDARATVTHNVHITSWNCCVQTSSGHQLLKQLPSDTSLIACLHATLMLPFLPAHPLGV